MKALESGSVYLRELSEDDFDAIHDYAQDARLCYFLNWGPNTEEQTREFLRGTLACQCEVPRRRFELAVVARDGDQVMGHGSIRITHPGHKEGEIHCVVGRKYWGVGHASATVSALLSFGFDQLKLHRIFATVDPENPAAAGMLECNGMQREAHIREHKWIKGQWRDSLLYSLLDYEWKESSRTPTAVEV